MARVPVVRTGDDGEASGAMKTYTIQILGPRGGIRSSVEFDVPSEYRNSEDYLKGAIAGLAQTIAREILGK